MENVQVLLPAQQSRWGAQSLPSHCILQPPASSRCPFWGEDTPGADRACCELFVGDVSYMRDGRGAAPRGCFHQNEPRVLPGAHMSTPALEDPSAAQPSQTGGPCSPLLGWLGGLCGLYVQPHSPTAGFFFQNRDLHNQIKSSFFSLCHLGAFCHLQSSIGKPEIRKPINPIFPVYLNYTEVQGQFPT